MSVTDPIADMLTRIRNALGARHETVLIPVSKVKLAIASLLKEEGFIRDYEVLKGVPHGIIKVHLLYREGNESAINGLKRVSKPGLRIYLEKGEIPRFYGGLGISVVSTSQGLMTGHETSRRGIGGELICYVW